MAEAEVCPVCGNRAVYQKLDRVDDGGSGAFVSVSWCIVCCKVVSS